MESKDQTINFLTYFISVYVGYFNVLNGLIGNIISILVFTQLRLFRRNQSAFYLIFASIVDSCELLFDIASGITVIAFDIHSVRTSNIHCKLRVYFAQCARTISTMTICFGAIDQYLSTSCDHQLRKISTLKLAQRLVFILVVCTFVYSIPTFIFHEVRRNADCASFHPTFNYFYSIIHYCLLIGLLPIGIALLFSLLAYRDVRRIIRLQMPVGRRRLDYQLTTMMLSRVILFVVTTLPYTSFRVHQINHSQYSSYTHSESITELFKAILTTIYNIDYSGSFYVFAISSYRFRRQVKSLFYRKLWRKYLSIRFNANQVAPNNQLQILESNETNFDAD